jgi:phosphate transport system ATP-binding protein
VTVPEKIKIRVENFNLRYSDGKESLRNITIDFHSNQINVLFGPGGGGKSSLLRAMNRLNDLTDVVEQSGKILIDGEDIYDPEYDVIRLRQRIGIVFARPVPLPMSIYRNLIYGLELMGVRDKHV